MLRFKLPLAAALLLGALAIQPQSAEAAPMLCPGVAVPPAGVDAGPALNKCIANTPDYGTLEIPTGVYTILTQVRITRPITLRTAGLGGSSQNCAALTTCATLKAGKELAAEGGLLMAQGTNDVVIDHLIFDGDRWNRNLTYAQQSCLGGYNRLGFNLRMTNCRSCRFTYNLSKNALCGTGLEYSGHNAVITDNVFRGNGYHQKGLWADGLTVIYSNGARITGNWLEDNSDVALIVGGAKNATIARNTIRQTRQVAFAGLMLFNFKHPSNAGSFVGTTVTGNTVDCGTSYSCHFGIMLGPHPWDTTLRIVGGTVTGNRVTGARMGINVEGAGDLTNRLVLYDNTATGSPSSAQFLCGTRRSGNLNINENDSYVDRRGDTTPVLTPFEVFHNCP